MRHTIIKTLLCLAILALGSQRAVAQIDLTLDSLRINTAMLDSLGIDPFTLDSLDIDAAPLDSIVKKNLSLISDSIDTVVQEQKVKKDWSTWRPNPKRALWLALVIPGGGQIYNRKYWKLPLIYGGFMGCIYAITWNNSQYKDYSKAYLDLKDSDPNTQSYNQFLHLGQKITPQEFKRYEDLFKKRKDKYRRWRDLSFFVMIGVYALSVIDAYVDAELSVFDISRDLSLKVEPTIINNHSSTNAWNSSSVGLQCSLNF